MPITNLHCSVCGAADPVTCGCPESFKSKPLAAYTLTSDYKHPCPDCGSLEFIHPQETEWDDGWCPHCRKWLAPIPKATPIVDDGWKAEDHTDFPLGELFFDSGSTIAPGETRRLEEPKGAPFGEPLNPATVFLVRPLSFGRFPERAEHWELYSLTINGEGQTVAPMPLSSLVGHTLVLATQLVGAGIRLSVTNISDKPRRFTGSMIAKFAVHKGELSERGEAELRKQRGQ